MTEHICKCADHSVIDGREQCYQAWSQHRDYWEEGDRVNANIGDFRCGFVNGYNAAVTAYRERVERVIEKAELFDAQTPHERAIFKALKSELAKGDATK